MSHSCTLATSEIHTHYGLMHDRWIRHQAQHHQMISPFAEHTAGGKISYGLSSYGYDARAHSDFQIFTNVNSSLVDPKNFDTESLVLKQTDQCTKHPNACIIPPNSFALTRTVEHFVIPPDVMVVCVGKSTYARCGIVINVTPLEAGWQGYITIEISNTTPLPAKIYSNEGICQLLFFRGQQCETTYADRKGKYMHQMDITTPRIAH